MLLKALSRPLAETDFLINEKLFWYLLSFSTCLFGFSFCTGKRTVRSIAGQHVYLEKKGTYCNLFYKNSQSKFILVSDSVKTITSYESVFAYSRAVFSTIPDMVIVKVDKEGNISKRYTEGVDFNKVFPTYFSFPADIKTSYASELYEFLGGEEVIDEKDIIKHL